MNTYYKIAIFYVVLAALFTIFGFYMASDLGKLEKFYKTPLEILSTEENENA